MVEQILDQPAAQPLSPEIPADDLPAAVKRKRTDREETAEPHAFVGC